MFDWLLQLIRPIAGDNCEHDDALSRIPEPTVLADRAITQQIHVGDLPLRSGTIVLGDPQYMPAVEVPGIAAKECSIHLTLRRPASGSPRIAAMRLVFGNNSCAESRRAVGQVAVDSARVVVADKADIDEHWTEVGPDRLGVISTASNRRLLRKLEKRFRLRTVQVNAIRAEVVDPISQSLEKEIEAYLRRRVKIT